jgi:DNA-binding NtrC family response regulator
LLEQFGFLKFTTQVNTTVMQTAPAQTPALGTSGKSALIYIVDDEHMVGEVVEVILNLEGYLPKFFCDPTEAYHAFAKADPRPALLLTDFLMSPINGMQLIEQCKRLQPGLKTILYSGNVGQEITRYYSTRPDAFLSKPFLPKTLVHLVQSVLAK